MKWVEAVLADARFAVGVLLDAAADGLRNLFR